MCIAWYHDFHDRDDGAWGGNRRCRASMAATMTRIRGGSGGGYGGGGIFGATAWGGGERIVARITKDVDGVWIIYIEWNRVLLFVINVNVLEYRWRVVYSGIYISESIGQQAAVKGSSGGVVRVAIGQQVVKFQWEGRNSVMVGDAQLLARGEGW